MDYVNVLDLWVFTYNLQMMFVLRIFSWSGNNTRQIKWTPKPDSILKEKISAENITKTN